jgi:hypothetical protein
MRAISLLWSDPSLPFWTWAGHILEFAVAVGVIGESYSHLIPDRFLPSPLRSDDKRKRVGKWSTVILCVSILLVVPIDISRDVISDRIIANLSSDLSKTQAKIIPWRLSKDDKQAMFDILSQASPSPIAVISRLLDSEGNDFADDLASVLTEAHWNVVRYRNWTKSDRGVFIATVAGTKLRPNDPTIRSLADALTAARIKYKIITISGNDLHTMSPWFQPQVLYLLIGARPH